MIKNFLQYIKEDYNTTYIYNEIYEKYFETYKDYINIDEKASNAYSIRNGKVYIGLSQTFFKNTLDLDTIKDYLFHEMSHIVYIDNFDRLLVNNYGLEIKTKDELGYSIALTWQATKNEIKVICWQKIISEHYIGNFNLKDSLKSLQYLPDFLNVPIYGDNLDKISYNQKDKLRLETIEKYALNELKNPKYNISNFDKRWFERCEFLKKSL